ncbi:phosphonatase-like hydrolase [Amycolatopsis suaedae]|uniref:Phosphonatase-like hydrolase n=1 Tax=Amycolatopsis suaedae TaxID=2510978 RepID=A0A4V2ELQ7_9PSEU|nr:phosphonatase-like hydrolase [Amycolatopsis suaedae]RZQ62405.1 phosphonatase-like hydrolase [Amycolatopsis suaedae]
MIALAALDIAGTTVAEDNQVYRVLAEVVAGHGTPVDDAGIRRWMGADKREALAALTGDPGAADRLHERFVARLRAAYAEHPPRPVPGVTEALATLREHGVRVVLTTGFDRQITDPLLAAVGWTVGDQLDAVVCAADVGGGRPQPLMIHRAMKLAGVTDPGRVLAAGDTVLDIQAGHAARAGHVVGVLSGAQTRDELAAGHPTHIVEHAGLLPELLGLR